MDHVISKYVYQFVSSKGEYLIYCSRSNSFLKLSKDLSKYIEECKNDSSLLNDLDVELLEALKKHKIIVHKNEDNDFLLERQFLEDQITFSTSTIGLVLVPTLACNFNCPYCFEEGKKASRMSDNIIDQLISFIKLHKFAKNLAITWYGGEPLLAFSTIQKILNKIHNEINLRLTEHSIITNGYYFTKEIIDYFKEHPLNDIQITLDGNKTRHDSIRKQKATGEGSYDILINNINNILDELPDVHLSVRVNIEKKNMEDFIDLYSELSAKWKNKNISIYPGILRIDNDDKTALASSALSQWEAFDLYYELRKKKMINGSIFPSLQYHKGCCATVVNSYIVGPKGEMYKCWNDVSNDKRIIGYISDEKLTNPSLFYRYIIGSKSYRDQECLDCFLLPVCSGNCAFYRLRNQHENGKYILCQCLQKSPNMLNKCLEYYYTQINL